MLIQKIITPMRVYEEEAIPKIVSFLTQIDRLKLVYEAESCIIQMFPQECKKACIAEGCIDKLIQLLFNTNEEIAT